MTGEKANPMSDNNITVNWSAALGDDVAGELADLEADDIAGDYEWRLGAFYLYDFTDGGYDTGSMVFEPGLYLRTVHGKQEFAYLVSGQVREYMQTIEAAWKAETTDEPPVQQACPECGAQPGQRCREANCQGTWQ